MPIAQSTHSPHQVSISTNCIIVMMMMNIVRVMMNIIRVMINIIPPVHISMISGSRAGYSIAECKTLDEYGYYYTVCHYCAIMWLLYNMRIPHAE